MTNPTKSLVRTHVLLPKEMIVQASVLGSLYSVSRSGFLRKAVRYFVEQHVDEIRTKSNEHLRLVP